MEGDIRAEMTNEAVDGFAAQTPTMYQQPVDASPPVYASDTESVRAFRALWASWDRQRTSTVISSIRRWIGRITGRSDRHLLITLRAPPTH